jgi:hypothetical protein
MPRPLVSVLLMLALLLQGLAPARAMTAAVDEPTTAEQVQAALPCHGAQAPTAEPAAAPGRTTMSCCDAGIDCGHCSAGCMATPALPAAMTTDETGVLRIVASARVEQSPPGAPPAERLRPPILSLR